MKSVPIIILLLTGKPSFSQNCYQDYIQTNPSNKIHRIGNYKAKIFYSEGLSFIHGSGTYLNVLLLRNDTAAIKDFDICFTAEGHFSTDISRIENDTNATKYSLKDVKPIFQILYIGLNFAKFDNASTKLFFKKGLLYLKYISGSCISGCPYYSVLETYKFKNGKFMQVSKKERLLK